LGAKAGSLSEDFEGVDGLPSFATPPFILGFNVEQIFPMIGHY
jgi:hypothetical protein